MELAYDRAGPAGGFPVLLVHGWPETRRIWARNVEPLADAGFDVIAPDLRGFGDSPLGEHYDLAAHARDLKALLDPLGIERCACVGGDLGGGVDHRPRPALPGAGGRGRCIFNSILPLLPDLPRDSRARPARRADYFLRQGRDADALAAELRTPEERRRYVATFYGSRFWASPGTFTPRGRRLSTPSRSATPTSCARGSATTRAGWARGRCRRSRCSSSPRPSRRSSSTAPTTT